MQYYKIQYHKRDEHIDNWYDWSGFNKYDNRAEAYEALLFYLQQKFTVFAHTEIDQFRIIFTNEEEVYTTWKL